MANTVTFTEGGERCRLTVVNNTQQRCSTVYEINVFDTDDGRWELHNNGTVTLGPGDRWSEEFHKWRANRWRYQVLSNRCS